MRWLRVGFLILCLLVAQVPRASAADTSLPEVVAKVSESVVGISVVKRDKGDEAGDPSRLIVASGSGFAIHADGYILTNAHVIDGAVSAYVLTADNRTLNVNPKSIWTDPASDLAVLKVSAKLTPVTWGDSTKLRLGDALFAMGAPYGLRFHGTVTRGILSGTERDLDVDYTFLQTDTPINPGNSGGPLFAADGTVVGINSRKIVGGDGMGFAIPAHVARPIAEKLMTGKPVERSWLGVQFMDEEEINLGWPGESGPVVSRIDPDGPAKNQDVRFGDTLAAVDGTPIGDLADLGEFLRGAAPGTPVELTIRRGGKEHQVKITLGSRPHGANLRYDAGGLWTDITAEQRRMAQAWGAGLPFLELADVMDDWTDYRSGSKAVLYTAYLTEALKSWSAERRSSTGALNGVPSPAADQIIIQVELPAKFSVTPSALKAEWQDAAGVSQATSVRLQDGARPGYQLLAIQVPTTTLEKHGIGVLVLTINAGTQRHFYFDLDSLH